MKTRVVPCVRAGHVRACKTNRRRKTCVRGTGAHYATACDLTFRRYYTNGLIIVIIIIIIRAHWQTYTRMPVDGITNSRLTTVRAIGWRVRMRGKRDDTRTRNKHKRTHPPPHKLPGSVKPEAVQMMRVRGTWVQGHLEGDGEVCPGTRPRACRNGREYMFS